MKLLNLHLIKSRQLDQESIRQQELIYNAEFQIQQMERKVARAGGERSDEEKIALNARIKEVQAVLDETKEQQRMLRQQCKKVMDELAVTRRKLVDVKTARKKGEARIAELQLVNDAGQTEVARSDPLRVTRGRIGN